MKIEEKQTLIKKLNILIEEKEKTIEENSKLLHIINNSKINNNNDSNLINSSLHDFNKKGFEMNLFDDFVSILEKIPEIKTYHQINNFIQKYRNNLLDMTNIDPLKIEFSSLQSEKIHTSEKQIQTEKFIQVLKN